MKKLLSILLCLLLICGVLVSCDEERTFGSYLPNYDYEPKEEEEVVLNLYIIKNDNTAINAEETVSLNIKNYTMINYNTELRVHYYTESQYQSKVIEEINANDADSANIVLINDLSMMTSLVRAGKLADLTDYLKTDEYGTLNVNVAKALLESAKINDKFYAIPNNHVVGEYEYLVIDKSANDVEKVFLPSMFNNDKGPVDFEGIDALVSEFKAKLAAKGKNPDDYIWTEKGSYELQEEGELGTNLEYLAIKNPTVDASVAFSSAFAIVDRGAEINERAMEILYAINMDKGLRDLFQYGVEGINYYVDEAKGVVIKPEADVYSMNPLYTGNIFTLSYSEQLGWTAAVAQNGKLQNEEAVVKTAE